MKILKPGKVEYIKIICPYCGCEFLATTNEMNRHFYPTDEYDVRCPQEGCHEHFTIDLEEPT